MSTPDALVAVGLRLRRLGAPERTRVWAMIETPLALLRAEAIASAARDVDTRLDCFVMGTNDLAKETRARAGAGPRPDAALADERRRRRARPRARHPRRRLQRLQDEAGFRAECEQGRDCGFDGKTLIHPNQIAVANEVFAPAADEVERARAIIAAFARPENASKGAISLDGRMVERHARRDGEAHGGARGGDRRERGLSRPDPGRPSRRAAAPPRAA